MTQRGERSLAQPQSPLDRVTSIKIKLGLLVAASVAVAAVLATIGAGGAVASRRNGPCPC